MHLGATFRDGDTAILIKINPENINIYHSTNSHSVSNMSAHVLFNLLNELGKSDKMRGLSSILSLFRNEFIKMNNT